MPVGRMSMTSLAKEGPDRKAQGWRFPRVAAMTSDMSAPVPRSRPLLTEMTGTCLGRCSCRLHTESSALRCWE